MPIQLSDQEDPRNGMELRSCVLALGKPQGQRSLRVIVHGSKRVRPDWTQGVGALNFKHKGRSIRFFLHTRFFTLFFWPRISVCIDRGQLAADRLSVVWDAGSSGGPMSLWGEGCSSRSIGPNLSRRQQGKSLVAADRNKQEEGTDFVHLYNW